MASDVIGRADGAVLTFPDAPERRLRVALRQLDAALAEQRSAVAAFRAELGSLKGALAGLEDSALALKAQLGETAEEAVLARQACATLLTTAEAFERQTAGG
jgi:peptidoglycan hydrolase CwlO-like protein